MATKLTFCPNCGTQNAGFNSQCQTCGTNLPNHSMPPQRVGNNYPARISGADNKIAAGICGILLGAFGVHKFILGYKNEGIIMLVTSLVGFLLCGIPTAVVSIVGLVEGIIYLTKSDEEFVATYVQNKKGWF